MNDQHVLQNNNNYIFSEILFNHFTKDHFNMNHLGNVFYIKQKECMDLLFNNNQKKNLVY